LDGADLRVRRLARKLAKNSGDLIHVVRDCTRVIARGADLVFGPGGKTRLTNSGHVETIRPSSSVSLKARAGDLFKGARRHVDFYTTSWIRPPWRGLGAGADPDELSLS
jgi:hypothetical protein